MSFEAHVTNDKRDAEVVISCDLPLFATKDDRGSLAVAKQSRPAFALFT